MKPLHILSVAYPFAPVTDDPAGGAEQVLAALDRALVRAGHRSTVLACEGSHTAGELQALRIPAGPIDGPARDTAHANLRAALADRIERERPDLVHLHGIDFADYLPAPGVPVLATLHLPLDWYAPAALRPARPDTHLQPVSADQASRAAPDLALLPPVPNGVDVEHYQPSGARSDYALVLGRVAPEKGFHHALDAARLADMPVRAAGMLFPYPAHRDYFDEAVKPRLDEQRRWLGPTAGEAKRRLLAEARCLLVPSTAPETSSLVAMEALASGTPVIAFRAGALPFIIDHGRTGFIVDNVEEMADAMRRLDEIDPAACRRAACDRFPLARTTAAYLDLYARLAA